MTHVNILMVGRIVSETQTDRQLKFIIYIYIYREREILLRPEATTRIKLKLSRFISQLKGYILLKRAVVIVVVW